VVATVTDFAQNALVWLRNAFDQIQPTLQRVGEIASEVFATVVAAVQAAIPPITEFISSVIETLVNVWGDVSQAVQDFYARFIEIFGPIAGWFNDNVVSTIVSAVEYLIEVFKTIYRLVAPGINLLLELFQFLAYTIANIVIFIVGRISDFVGTIARIFIGFFDYLKPMFSLFWDGLVLIVKTVFEIFENTIEIGLAVIRGLFEIGTALLKGDFGAVWDAMKQIVIDVFDAIKDLVVTSFDNIVGFLKTVPGKIASATVGMFDGIKNAFKEAINFIIRGWNRLEFRVPGFSIGPIGYDGFTLGVPDIPLLADGGIVNRATLAVIGEAGPEAVVPLDQMRGGIGGATYNITVQAGVGDPGSIGQSVVEAITAYERRNGAGWRAA
jgi:phage-related protein